MQQPQTPETRLTVSLLAVFVMFVAAQHVGRPLIFVVAVAGVVATGEAALATLTMIRQEATSND